MAVAYRWVSLHPWCSWLCVLLLLGVGGLPALTEWLAQAISALAHGLLHGVR